MAGFDRGIKATRKFVIIQLAGKLVHTFDRTAIENLEYIGTRRILVLLKAPIPNVFLTSAVIPYSENDPISTSTFLFLTSRPHKDVRANYSAAYTPTTSAKTML